MENTYLKKALRKLKKEFKEYSLDCLGHIQIYENGAARYWLDAAGAPSQVITSYGDWKSSELIDTFTVRERDYNVNEYCEYLMVFCDSFLLIDKK